MPEKLAITPEQFIIQLQAKSKEAFSVLYDSYSEALYGIICRVVNNSGAAEDLLQDVFVKIWKKIDTYNSTKGTLFTWMINIARHECIDYLRSKQHRQDRKTITNVFDWHEETAPPDYNITGTELHKITRQLEEKYRLVIEMVYLRGYTHDETASILNIPVGTVKTRTRAALKQLRNLYN